MTFLLRSGTRHLAAILMGLAALFTMLPRNALANISPPGCTGSGLGLSLFADKKAVGAGDTINYSVLVFNTPFPACDATGITAEITTPDGVSHPIVLRRTALVPGDSDYYANVVSYVVRAQDVLPNNTLDATASDQGDIHQNVEDSRGGGFQGVETTVDVPCIQITANCVGATGENGAITFTGTIKNCGNAPLTGVIVTNSVNGGSVIVLGPVNLATNQSMPFSGSWVPTNPCAPSTATFFVAATDSRIDHPVTVTATTTTTCQNTLTPSIIVTKACPTAPVAPGQTIVYTGTVANTGDVTLHNVTVVSDLPVPNTVVYSAATLAPGASADFTGSYAAPTNCSSTGTVTASGTSTCGTVVSKSATSTCPIVTTPHIVIVQTCPSTAPVPGGTATYTGHIQNTGNIGLTGVVITSDSPAPNTVVLNVGNLAPGASVNFTTTVPVTLNSCAVISTVHASGTDACSGTVVNDTTVSTCPLTTAPSAAITLACPATAPTPGSPALYTGTIRNTGNNTLQNVQVQNSQGIFVLTLTSLAPGASTNYSFTINAPTDGCSTSVSVAVTGIDSCSQAAVRQTAFVTCDLATSPQIAVTKTCPTGPVAPGQNLVYSGTVSNAGNVTLTNVTVISDQPVANTVVFQVASLAPGASASFTGSYVAPTNCASTSTVTASGTSLCGVPVSKSATTTCPILTTPRVAITQTCPATSPVPGGSATYTGTVRNTGDIALTEVIITSDYPTTNTVVLNVGTLLPGGSANFSTVVPVTINSCAVTSTVHVRGKDCSGLVVQDTTTTSCPITTAPSVAISLACPLTSPTPGALVTYTGTVRNTGNNTLQSIKVVNNEAKTVFTLASLAPGAATNFTSTITAALDACSVTSGVIVTGTDSCSLLSVTNDTFAICPITTTPKLTVTANCPVVPPTAGGLLTFTGTVQNTGNITLTNVSIFTDKTGVQVLVPIGTLAPGAATNYTASFTVPASASCSISYTVLASGFGKCDSQLASASVANTCPLLDSPGILVTLFCPSNPPPPGGTLSYTGTVKNTGNVTLTNVVVVENRPAPGTVVFTAATLAPGAVANFSGQYKVPPNCCTVSSTAIASGADVCSGRIVTDEMTQVCPVKTTPGITVTAVCPTEPSEPGDVLKYTGTVSNTGDIALENVFVYDNMPAPNTKVIGPIVLAPGETVNFRGSFTVPNDFCGTHTLVASGKDICGGAPVSKSVTVTCPILTTPELTVTKDCPAQMVPKGGLFTFTGIVMNTGNVTLTDIFVVDNYPTNGTPVIGPITLAPGAFTNFSGSYIAPKCCCEIVDTLTATGKDKCDSHIVQTTASQVCELLTSPALSVVKFCPTGQFPAGSLFSYSGAVTNSGDTTLTNVVVTANRPGDNTVLVGPIDLAPGESQSFTGSYTVPANSDPSTDIVVATGNDACRGTAVAAKADCVGAIPLAGNPILSSPTSSKSGITITWASSRGSNYIIQYSDTINNPNWIALPGTITATGDTAQMTDSSPAASQRYYRVLIVQ
jgi:uncharacterized repeat protein (TIGR01451 family)